MLKEFAEWVRNNVLESQILAPIVLKDVPNQDRAAWIWNPSKKEFKFIEVDPPVKRHTLLSLSSMMDMVKDSGEAGHAFWIGRSSVELEMRFGDDRDRMRLALQHTPFWERLHLLRKNPKLDQQEAIRLVRQRFFDFNGGVDLLSCLKSLRITKTEDTNADISHEASRLGKSIVSRASGASGEIPEFIDIASQVYVGIDSVAPVRVWISVDFDSKKIVLEPDFQHLEDGERAARASIKDMLQEGVGDKVIRIYEGEYSVKSK